MGEQFGPRGPFGDMGMHGQFPGGGPGMRGMRPPGAQQFPPSSEGGMFPPGQFQGQRPPFMDIRAQVIQ